MVWVVVGESGCGLGCGSGALLLLITPAGMISGRKGRANKVSTVVRYAGDGNGIFSVQDIKENSQLNFCCIILFFFSFLFAHLGFTQRRHKYVAALL